jgi:hypothetical protein
MDASVELIRSMLDRLRADATVTQMVGDRIVDRPSGRVGSPTGGFPYISVGPTSSIPADFDCMDGEELTVQLDIWTTGDNGAFASVDCRTITNAVKRSLHNADLALADNALVTLTWELTRILDDPNPAIRHGAIQFTAIVETP